MIQPASGILLIAEPFLKDPNFMRTVVFLCEHQDAGSIGFVLNKQYVSTLDELMEEFEGYRIPVYYGGPVQRDSIHFLHQCPELIPDSTEVTPGIYWGGNFESVSALIRSNEIDLNRIRFYLGYSGWGDGQLNSELEQKSWLTVKATPNLVFHKKTADIWKDSLKLLGGEYEIMINFPIDPQLN